MLPGEYLGITVLLVLATVPVAALQSALSMFLRSFAAPVAIALVASGISTATLMVLSNAALVSPYGLATHTALSGTGSFIDSGSVTAGDAIAIVVAALLLLSVLIVATTVAVLNRRDTRI